jgi:hypothetical protein
MAPLMEDLNEVRLLDAYVYHVEGLPRAGWKLVALNRERWHALEDHFVSQAWYR